MKEDGKFKQGHSPWNKGKRIKLDLNIIRKKYLEEDKSTYEIGKELNVSQKTIENRLKEVGIKLRSKSEPTKRTIEKIRNTMKKKGIKPLQKYNGKPTKGCFKIGGNPWNKDKTGLQTSDKKGKTYEELYGLDNSKQYKKLIRNRRRTQVLPTKDTKIEIKIQNFLKKLNIEFLTHQYIKIKHGYQCDVFIPSLNLIIECDGDYWHKYPVGRKIDKIRTKELIKSGFKVIRLWEREIKKMNFIDFKKRIHF